MRVMISLIAILFTVYCLTACPASGERNAEATPVGKDPSERASQHGETRGAKIDPKLQAQVLTDLPHGPAPQGATFNWLPSIDGMQVASWYFAPKKADAPGVILIHQRASDKSSWGGLPAKLVGEGYAVIAIDLRGHGETSDKAGNRKPLDSLTTADYKAMMNDVAAAHSFLKQQKNVDGERVALIGASIGANLAIMYTATDRTLRAAVALSPGLDYFGLRPADSLSAYSRRPLYLICAMDDKLSYDDTLKLEELAISADPVHTRYFEASAAHGTDLFAKHEGVDELIISFFKNSIPASL